ncbi:lysosomal alpha-mannosidase-like [Haliotis asinina]|uniref:lysosomal alpha-mannosidase-like n=1 Tax=Haliotis asinina TaxID=109174 RepID=UPI0035318A14
MRFKLKRFALILAFFACISFIIHIMDLLKFKPRSRRPKIELHLDPPSNTGTCDKSKCNPTMDGMLNVHIVAHSHDDVGWKKTMDQYYTGQGGGNAESFYHGGECTKCILDNAVRELIGNPLRRFIFVEMAFLSVWYNEQTEDMKKQVKRLIDERRLELIIGGWSMSDSATTYYDDVIDQHTYGFQWIQKELGECAMPKSGWHVDQFGHSREHSSIFAQFGFDGLFLGRIDFQDQERRTKTSNMETLWRTSPDNLGDKTSLFTSVLYDGYFSPERFRWEGWGPGMLSARNSENYVNAFIDIAVERAKAYKTKHVLIPFGGDFAFNTAAGWFDGIDNLIKYVNAKQATGSKVNVLYSTPTCYINSVNREAVTLETMSTDFFPYSTIPNTFWTGFFTSRPGLKRHVKVASSLLQTCKEMAVLAQLEHAKTNVDKLKSAVGVLQHHDAITGTEMQHVTDDYNKMLSEGELACQSVIDEAYRILLPQAAAPKQEFCPLLNISFCPETETPKTFFVNLFNPLGWPVTHFVRLPIPGGTYKVIGEGKVTAETVPLSSSTAAIPERSHSKAKAELVFRADVPPLGFASYKVSKETSSNDVPPLQDNTRDDIVIENEFLLLTVDAESGLTKTLTNKVTQIKIEFEQSYRYYLSSEGQQRDPNDRTGGFLGSHKRASGAYAFVPKEGQGPVRLNGRDAKGVNVKTFKGVNALEIHQEFSSWMTQVIRLYDGAPYLELEWTVGPLPDENRETKEVISHFTTDLQTRGVVYTDSNGREMIQRRLDKRETWNLTVTSPISGNYYPVTGRIALQDQDKQAQLTVLTDRCQGGASIKDGEIELLVHRRTFKDDDLGVQEPLNEKGVDGRGLIIRGKHYVFLNTIEKTAQDFRPLGLQFHHPPTVSFSAPQQDVTDSLHTQWSGLSAPLPSNVHLLTLDQVPGKVNKLLLRLENIFERRELAESERIAELDLEDLFSKFRVTGVRELTLGANHNVSSVRRLRWKKPDGSLTPSQVGSTEGRYKHEAPFTITLTPMEIRTFHIDIIQKNYQSGT